MCSLKCIIKAAFPFAIGNISFAIYKGNDAVKTELKCKFQNFINTREHCSLIFYKILFNLSNDALVLFCVLPFISDSYSEVERLYSSCINHQTWAKSTVSYNCVNAAFDRASEIVWAKELSLLVHVVRFSFIQNQGKISNHRRHHAKVG